MTQDLTRFAQEMQAALAVNPRDPAALTGMAWLLRQDGRLRDAVLHCDAALRADPHYVAAWLERGFILSSGGSMAGALASYRRAAELDPVSADAHAGIASIMARDGDSAEARGHAVRALELDPDNAIAAAALATMQLEAGEVEAAGARLASLAPRIQGPSADRSLVWGLLGDSQARLGYHDEAYASYARAKADFAAINAPRMAGRESHRAFIDRHTAALRTIAQPAAPPLADPIPQAARSHVFLLGYPRSGTTLVENILASLPGVAALEERPTLAEADMAFLAEPGGLEQFARLDADALQPYRQAYWDKVAQAGIEAPGRCFVDMDPLKGTRLPLIGRLFPEARILVMRRDPRDVVWSCFHTQFALTNAALEFTSLERTARHYAAMMELIETARQRLALTVHEVSYEGLVRDFEAETRAICAFLDLEWSEDLRRFDRTAQTRGVATASAGQVRRGLYDGSGQWRPYGSFFEPVMPILAPWIEKFGYPA
jgi:tetratricopeptide (TPR) repeat protein